LPLHTLHDLAVFGKEQPFFTVQALSRVAILRNQKLYSFYTNFQQLCDVLFHAADISFKGSVSQE
jgi:hypothetical protein